MKKYVRKEKEEGVSPVIATILMVAITVVLAATLYLMVGNMGTTTSNQTSGSFSVQPIDSKTYKVSFSKIVPDTSITKLKLVVQNGSASDTFTWSSDTSGTAGSSTTSNTNVVVTYYDLADNHVINSGDYLTLTVKSGNTYQVTLLDSSGNEIHSETFTP